MSNFSFTAYCAAYSLGGRVNNSVLICKVMLSSSDSSMTLSTSDSMLCVHTVCAGLINKVCCMWGDAQTSHTHANQNKVSIFGSDCGPAINLEFPSVPHRSVLELMSLLIQWANMAWHTLIPEEQREREKKGRQNDLSNQEHANQWLSQTRHNVPTCSPDGCSYCIYWLSYGRFRNMHSSEAGEASLNLSILKSPLILFNSIKNWTTTG